MLNAGDPFPKFSLPDENGDLVTNADLAGHSTIVYFYGKDDTPG